MLKTIVLEELPEHFWQLVECGNLTIYFVPSDYPEAKKIDIAIIRTKVQFTENLMDKFPNLKLIIRAGTGIDNVDLESAAKRSIFVTNTPEANAQCAFEHTLSFISAMIKNLQQAKTNVLNNKWKNKLRPNFEFSELRVLVVGLGRVGSKVALALRFLGAQIKAVDPYLGKGYWKQYQIEETTYEAGLRWCNVLTFHCPLTIETESYFNETHLHLLKTPIFLLNTARGKIIPNSAIEKGLKENLLLGAGLDVYNEEPCSIQSWYSDERVYLTPHIGSFTESAKKRLSEELFSVWKKHVFRKEIWKIGNEI
jgi:D-3-phosphoglycerate dehydrogenase